MIHLVHAPLFNLDYLTFPLFPITFLFPSHVYHEPLLSHNAKTPHNPILYIFLPVFPFFLSFLSFLSNFSISYVHSIKQFT